MKKEKANWADISSLEGLEIDWQFEPANPLGKRAWARIVNKDLYQLLGIKKIPVRVVSNKTDDTGYLLDLCQNGAAILLERRLDLNQQVKIGFILGKQKIVSRAIIRNLREEVGKCRTGIEFAELSKANETFIAGLISSKGYKTTG